MKRFYIAFLSLLVINCASAQWVNLGNQGFTTVPVKHSSMTIDNAGIPIVGYVNDVTRRGTVMKYQIGANNWDTLGNAELTGSGAEQILMAADNAGTIYAAYVNGAAAGASVKKLVGNTWTLVGAAGFTGALNAAPSLEQYWDFDLGPTGIPYVATINPATSRPQVFSFNGTTWSQVGTVPLPDGMQGGLNLEVNTAGDPVIAYLDVDANTGDNLVKVLRYNGTNWVNATFAGSYTTPNQLGLLRMKLDNSNTPIFVVRDYSPTTTPQFEGHANMFRASGGSWVNVGSQNFTNAPYFDMSFVIDNTNAPMVAFPNGASANSNKPTVLRFNGTSWTPVGNTLFTSNGISLPSLVVDNKGNPYISFQDWSFGFYNTVMQLSTNPLSVYDIHLIGSAVPGKNNLSCALDESITDGMVVFERSDNGIDFTPISNTNITEQMVKTGFVKFSDINTEQKPYHYRAKYVNLAGQGTYTNIITLSTVQNDAIGLYPNPAKDFLYIQANEKGIAHVIDASGQVIKSLTTANVGTAKLDVSMLPAGIYAISLPGAKSVTFVKQ